MKIISLQGKNHFDCGYMLGVETKGLLHEYVSRIHLRESWETTIEKSKPYLEMTTRYFPEYIREIQGMANGSGITFDILFALHCLEEIEETVMDRCTTVCIKQNGGYIVGHNEDWETWTKQFHFILKRTMNGLHICELGLVGSIGGSTVSVNSFGLIQTINQLEYQDRRLGIPKSFIARWVSEQESLDGIKQGFPEFIRASGYNHVCIQNGQILDIESSACKQTFYTTKSSYFHTNHFLGPLRTENNYEDKGSSKQRFKTIEKYIGAIRTTSQLWDLLLEEKEGPIYSRANDFSTVATVVIDTIDKKWLHTTENNGQDTKKEAVKIGDMLP